MEKHYHEIYICKEVLYFLENWKKNVEEKYKPQPPVIPTEPTAPEIPKFEKEVFLILLVGLLICLFSVKVYIGFLLICIFFSIGTYVSEKKIYKEKNQIYQTNFKEYRELKVSFGGKEKSFVESLKIFEKSIKSNAFFYSLKHREIIEIISRASPANVTYNNPIRGRSEATFQNFLRSWFGEAISTNRVIEVFEYEKHSYDNIIDEPFFKDVIKAYVPDFYFRHPLFNLNIDIEIDEPYTSVRLNPIHYIGNISDANRNNYFLNNRWFIIRFSEEQVVAQPQACCREIAELIYDFSGDDSYLRKMKNIPRVLRMRKWTEGQAKELIKNKKRNYYQTNNEKDINTCYSINRKWDNEKSTLYINGLNIEYIIKDTLKDKKSWKTFKGTCIYEKDIFERHILHISWSNGKYEDYIIDMISNHKLIYTETDTRNIVEYDLFRESSLTIPLLLNNELKENDSLTIYDTKELIGVPKLAMVRQLTKAGDETELFYHWDKEKRIRVTMHETIFEKIKKNSNIDTLILAKEVIPKNGETENYDQYFVSEKICLKN